MSAWCQKSCGSSVFAHTISTKDVECNGTAKKKSPKNQSMKSTAFCIAILFSAFSLPSVIPRLLCANGVQRCEAGSQNWLMACVCPFCRWKQSWHMCQALNMAGDWSAGHESKKVLQLFWSRVISSSLATVGVKGLYASFHFLSHYKHKNWCILLEFYVIFKTCFINAILHSALSTLKKHSLLSLQLKVIWSRSDYLWDLILDFN